jgi:AraC-like DNA-binding protein
MNSRLRYIENWEELAKQANWSVTRLAQLSGVSRKTLLKYFVAEKGIHPKEWLINERQAISLQLLRNGYSVKEVATAVGYKNPSSFSREFKNQRGVYPSHHCLHHRQLESKSMEDF